MKAASKATTLEGDKINSLQMKINSSFESEQDSNESLIEDDFVYSRDWRNHLYFKMQGLSRTLTESPFFRDSLDADLIDLKTYAKSRIGLGPMLFFAVYDTHFLKSDSSLLYKMFYKDLKTATIKLQGTSTTINGFMDYKAS